MFRGFSSRQDRHPRPCSHKAHSSHQTGNKEPPPKGIQTCHHRITRADVIAPRSEVRLCPTRDQADQHSYRGVERDWNLNSKLTQLFQRLPGPTRSMKLPPSSWAQGKRIRSQLGRTRVCVDHSPSSQVPGQSRHRELAPGRSCTAVTLGLQAGTLRPPGTEPGEKWGLGPCWTKGLSGLHPQQHTHKGALFQIQSTPYFSTGGNVQCLLQMYMPGMS